MYIGKTTMQSTYNWSLHSVAAAYVLGLAPHGWYFVKMMRISGGKATNLL
jgi:hypothetical protein